MRPRTHFQNMVVASLEKRQPLTPRIINWVLRHEMEHLAFHSGKTAVCSDCGSVFIFDGQDKTVRCPACGRMLNTLSGKRVFKNSSSFSLFQVVSGIQVMRVFQIHYVLRKGSLPDYEIIEVVDIWFGENGHYEVTALRRPMLSWCVDIFCKHSSMELRKPNGIYESVADSSVVVPYNQLTPYFERKGLKAVKKSTCPFTLFRSVDKRPEFETIVKAGNIRHANILLRRKYTHIDDIWNSYKITVRNHYKIQDFDIWLDMLTALRYCGKDVMNSHYVCPANLKEAHDYWIKREQLLREKEREREKLRKAFEDENEFIRNKGKYFGISFSDEEIKVIVLESIRAYQEEGKRMHHCVASYYNRPYSLILSARKGDEIIETVELSLRDYKVLQARGKCNGTTKYHQRIIELVERNSNLFAKASAS